MAAKADWRASVRRALLMVRFVASAAGLALATGGLLSGVHQRLPPPAVDDAGALERARRLFDASDVLPVVSPWEIPVAAAAARAALADGTAGGVDRLAAGGGGTTIDPILDAIPIGVGVAAGRNRDKGERARDRRVPRSVGRRHRERVAR